MGTELRNQQIYFSEILHALRFKNTVTASAGVRLA